MENINRREKKPLVNSNDNTTILQHSDPDNTVFQLMDKKRAEGKHFYVYTVAGAAKFLRIYYARVKAHPEALNATPSSAA